jgi:hypothetical protein
VPDHDAPPVLPLSARETGRTEPTLCEGVPLHLDGPLRAWAREFLHPDLAQRVALRLRLALPDAEPQRSRRSRSLLGPALHGRRDGDDLNPDPPSPPAPRHLVDDLTNAQLLDAVDMGLQLDRQLASDLNEATMAAGAGQPIFVEMERLDAARSLQQTA